MFIFINGPNKGLFSLKILFLTKWNRTRGHLDMSWPLHPLDHHHGPRILTFSTARVLFIVLNAIFIFIITSSQSYLFRIGSVFKSWLLFSVLGSLFAGLMVHAMDQTTSAPEVTTEDASGRLLSLPTPEKCANRK